MKAYKIIKLGQELNLFCPYLKLEFISNLSQ